MSEIVQFDKFTSPQLNQVGAQIISNLKEGTHHLQEAYHHYSEALIRRWTNGKLIHQNYDEIMEECGSQRAFSEKIGITESMVSNDLRAYKALLDEGCETREDVKDLLDQKDIPRTVKSWEKLPKLLSEPKSKRQKDNRPKDEQRLQDLEAEADEILRRNQGGLREKALEVKQQIGGIKREVYRTDPLTYDWRSREYLDWVKSLGMDFLTMTPSEDIDPHHCNPQGWAGNIQEKLPDCFTIPVTRKLHSKIENGKYNPSHKELSEALIRTMSLFIMTHFKNDK